MDPVSEHTRRMLEEYSTVVVVGVSADPTKSAHSVPAAMQAYGWRVVPVNPRGGTLLGVPAYPTLADVPEPVEFVNVFRRPHLCADVARDAVAAGAKAIWLQAGITSAEARRIAEDAGMTYVEDRCVMVEHRRHGIGHVG